MYPGKSWISSVFTYVKLDNILSRERENWFSPEQEHQFIVVSSHFDNKRKCSITNLFGLLSLS